MLTCCLEALGGLFAVILLLKFLNIVRTAFLQRGSINVKKYQKAGDWAVVTGASDGIGRAMAVELGRRGMNVVLIARTEAKLKEVAAEIESGTKPVRTKVIPFDFSTATQGQYQTLFSALDTVALAVLVNNVGVSTDYPQPFDESNLDEELRMLTVNCASQLQMTKYAVKRLKRSGCGAIVNLSSLSAYLNVPFLSVYSATKAFNRCFSSSLASELQTHHIDVLSVTPNLVATAMTQGNSLRRPRPGGLFVDAETMAHETLNQLGKTEDTAGHSRHALVQSLMLSVPGLFLKRMLRAEMWKRHLDGQRKNERRNLASVKNVLKSETDSITKLKIFN